MNRDMTTTGPNAAPSRVPERRRLTNAVVTLLSIGNSGEEMVLARELANIERCSDRPDIIRETPWHSSLLSFGHVDVRQDQNQRLA
jgi:hypothetical protein